MHAIRQHEFGSADVLQLETIPDPLPGPGQVRIAVEAAGVHRLDVSIRAGEGFGALGRPELPMVPGREVAGVIDAVGVGLAESLVGQRTVAHLGAASGGYAEFAVVDAGRAYEVPDGLDAVTAVAAIGTGRTAAAVLELAGIRPDDVVAITSAAGGLGVLFLQAVRAAGARSVALSGGGAKRELALRYGADAAIDYRTPDWQDEVRAAAPRLTLVLDGLGGEIPRTLHRMLPPEGRMVRFSGDTDGYDGPAPIADVLGPVIASRLAEFERRALDDAAAGRLVPHVGSVFPLSEAAAAHRALEERTSLGKVVLGVRAADDAA